MESGGYLKSVDGTSNLGLGAIGISKWPSWLVCPWQSYRAG
jgi:hypothetical protein